MNSEEWNSGEVRVNAGDDVLLRCNSSTDAAITKIKWERPDLDHRSVFFFRDNKSMKSYQDPRYRGRVELKDPEMKNGDVSVVLKEVTVSDTGTYQCRVTTSNMPTELLHSVHLVVSEGLTKEELKKQVKEQSGEIYGLKSLLVGLVVLFVILGVVVGFSLGYVWLLKRFHLKVPVPKPQSGTL
nr:CD276 antigen homolog [Pseudochaenichthys georgianus]